MEVPFHIIVTGTYNPDPRNETKAAPARQAIRDIHFRSPVSHIEKALKNNSELLTYLKRNFPQNSLHNAIQVNTQYSSQLQHILNVKDDNTFTFEIPFLVRVTAPSRPGILRANIQSASEDILQIAKKSFNASKYFSNIDARVRVHPDSANRANNATRKNRKSRKNRRRNNTYRRG